MDYRWTSSGFTHVEGGAAVKYTLAEAGSGREVFAKTVTSTQDIKKSLFEDSAPVMVHALAGALGENAAQAARELARLRKEDIKPK